MAALVKPGVLGFVWRKNTKKLIVLTLGTALGVKNELFFLATRSLHF